MHELNFSWLINNIQFIFKTTYTDRLYAQKFENPYFGFTLVLDGCLITILFMFPDIILYCLKQDNIDDSYRDELLCNCLRHEEVQLYHFFVEKVTEYYMKTDPLVISQFFNDLLHIHFNVKSSFRKQTMRFVRMCRAHAHLGFPQRLEKAARGALASDDKSWNRKRVSLLILAHLLEPEEFLQIVAPYYPTGRRPDITTEEGERLFLLQQRTIAALKSTATLPGLLKFCTGDYLKFARKNLYSAAYNTPESSLPRFLEELTRGGFVSVRKNAMHLTLKLMDKAHRRNLLTKLVHEENDSSMRKHVFRATAKAFVGNPDDYLWELFKSCVPTVDLNDQEVIETFSISDKVPLPYKPQYVTFAWNTLEDDTAKGELLQSVSAETIKALSNEWCVEVIKSAVEADIGIDFIVNYIVFSPSQEQETRLVWTFNCVVSKFPRARVFIHNFIVTLCKCFIYEPFAPMQLLAKTIELFDSAFKPFESFFEYLYLRLTALYVNSKADGLNVTETACRVGEFCDSILSRFSVDVNCVFCNVFKQAFLPKFAKDDLEVLDFIDGLIRTSRSAHCLLFVISILPGKRETTAGGFDNVTQMLLQTDDRDVKISLNAYLRKGA